MMAFASLISSCSSSKEISEKNVKDPCGDSLYVKLKSINKKEMSEQQLSYFKAKEKECKEFKEADEGGFGKYVIFIVLGALVAAFIIALAISPPNLSPH